MKTAVSAIFSKRNIFPAFISRVYFKPLIIAILILSGDFVSAQNSYFFYSFTSDPWTFNRRNDDGSAQALIYNPPTYQINETAADGSNNKVYFYETGSNLIYRSDFDGTSRSGILTALNTVCSMAAGNGYLFYSYSLPPYSVRRCNSDGSGDIQLYVNPSYGTVYNIAYDAVNNYLYYYEQGYDNVNNRIFRTDAGGANFVVIYNNCPKIQSLSAGAGYVFYSLWDSPYTFNRMNSNGSSSTVIYTPPTGTVMESSYDATINKLIFYDNDVSGSKTVYKSDYNGAGRTTLYSGFSGNLYSLAAPSDRFVAFSNGSGFSQSITPNSTNQVLGRFRLTGLSGGAVLTAVTIRLDNVRTGLSNFKLWSSADASFAGDTQIGSTVAADPGTGSSVTFSGMSNAVSNSGTYYFLTADVSSGSTGTVQGVLADNSSITLSLGTLSGSISNAVLSDNAVPLPVEMENFTAVTQNGGVLLKWSTASELNSYGFEIERRMKSEESIWEKIGFVRGQGNSNNRHEYQFADKMPSAGDVLYRLKQVDTDGQYKYYDALSVRVEAPEEFKLLPNSPNPFNPSTAIKFQIPMNSRVSIRIYDQTGREVITLSDEEKPAGSHIIYWNGKDKNGSAVSSGVYFCRLTAGSSTGTMKMILAK